MDKVERWITQKLASAVAAGIGRWEVSSVSAFGKSIYKFADGSIVLTLSELGFSYDGPMSNIECRYDEIEALKLVPLREVMRLQSDLDAPVVVGIIMRSVSRSFEMRWPFRVYSSVATVLDRIVRELI